jgi:hypothetical protein
VFWPATPRSTSRPAGTPARSGSAASAADTSAPTPLPADLRTYLQDLLRDRERVLAAGELDEWARTEAVPSETEIKLIRQLVRRSVANR